MFTYVLLVIVLMFLVKGFVFFTVSRCICAVNEQCALFFCYLNPEIHLFVSENMTDQAECAIWWTPEPSETTDQVLI